MRGVVVVGIVIAGILWGCAGAPARGGQAVDATGRKLFEQSFEPPYPPTPPNGTLTRATRVTLDPGRRVLTVEFTGANAYLDSDGCSRDYSAWAGMTAAGLEVAIVELGRIHLVPVSCLGAGYLHTHRLVLPTRYDGVAVVDRAGGTHLVGEPAALATLASFPAGWSVVHEEAGCCGTEPPVWVRVYAAAPVAEPMQEGAGTLVFHQALGLSDEWDTWRAQKSQDRGGHPEAATMGGLPVTVWVDPTTGELLLAWDQGGRSFGLVGNSADMTVEELIGYAESLEAPS